MRARIRVAMGDPTAAGARQALALGLGAAAVALVGPALAEAFEITLLVNPVDAIATSGVAAWIGVGLLVADIVLPVPSSVVMLAHGALFGVIPGAALSLLGRTGNAVVGAAVVGALPEAVLYAVAGDVAASYAYGAIVFLAVIVLATAAWAASARIGTTRSRRRVVFDEAAVPRSEMVPTLEVRPDADE